MSYCINPHCQNPQNSPRQTSCQSCGASLRLKGRYRIFKILGESTVSRTFLAVDEDQPSKPQCTIKQFLCADRAINDGKTDLTKNLSIEPDFTLRAKELDKIGREPSIPELFASFEFDGDRYFVHEYIRGRNLAEELNNDGVFREIQIWNLLGTVLPVLQVVHENGMIHGDVKPENIVRSPQVATTGGSRLALVDFGSALPLADAERDGIGGAAEYAAPERIRGHLDPRSDLYSLGVTCLHLLTQVSPFDLFDVKSNTWVWRDYLKRPVSRRLGRILDTLVQRNPAKRYQSAAEAIEVLRRGSGVVPVAQTRKQQWMLTAWGGIALTILSLILASRLPAPVPETSRYPNPVKRMPDIQPTIPKLDSPNSTLYKKKLSAVRTLVENEGPVWSIAVSPDGQIVASGKTDGDIELVDLKTGHRLNTLAGHHKPVGAIAIAPGGRLLASAGGDQTIRVWDLWSGRLKMVLPGHRGWVHALAFSPDGRTIASTGQDGAIRLWDAYTGIEQQTLRGYGDRVQAIAFSPDGQTLVSGGSNGMVELWNPQTGQLIRSFSGHTSAIWSVAIAPDGQTLATGSWDRTIRLWDLDRLESEYFSNLPLQTLAGHGDKIQSLSFSPDGQTLASGDFAGTVKLWQTGTGGLMGTLKGHQSWVNVAFNPRGKTLVSGSFDDNIKVWQLSF
ncbi:MAG: protein kinase domain-containing protein [Limnospira sp.]